MQQQHSKDVLKPKVLIPTASGFSFKLNASAVTVVLGRCQVSAPCSALLKTRGHNYRASVWAGHHWLSHTQTLIHKHTCIVKMGVNFHMDIYKVKGTSKN